MAEGGVAGLPVRLHQTRQPYHWDAPIVLERMRESERFFPQVIKHLSDVFQCDVVKADRLFDVDRACDLRLRFRTLDLVGVKMISAGLAERYPAIFRCRWMPDVPSEFTKWLTGYPHYLYIGHKGPHGIVGWYILDMGIVVPAMASPRVRFVLRKGVADPTSHYLSFNVLDFPRGTIVACGGTMAWLTT